jgi:hypothetical protein
MSIREGLLNIEKRWAWSFFGFLLAIIFGAIAIYTTFLQDKNPKLEYIIEGKTPVLDLREDIKNLDILYKGINIKEQDKNLSVITLKVLNNSDVTILKGFYDDLSPLQIWVENANIVDKPQVISTSNDYLKENAKVDLDSIGYVHLPKLIIEGQESYTISLLILHKNGVEPSIKGQGKIAGQKDGIAVISNYTQKSELSFWDKLIYGNIWIHIVRFIGYFFALIITVLAIVIPIALISEAISERKKKNRVKNYKNKKEIENSPETDAVFDLYLENSLDELITIQKLIGNESRLKAMLRGIERKDKRDRNISAYSEIQEREIFRDEEIIHSSDRLIRHRVNPYERAARNLKEVDMVKFESNNVMVNEKFVKELTDFISYLKLI